MFLLDELLENANSEDFSLKSIDPRESSYNEETDNELFREAYTKASVSIKVSYENHEKLFREINLNIIQEPINTFDFDKYISIEASPLLINPSIECNLYSWISKYFEKEDCLVGEDSDEIVKKFSLYIGSKINSDDGIIPQIPHYLGKSVKMNFPLSIINSNRDMIRKNIFNLNDDLYLIYELISQKLSLCKNPMIVEALARMFDYCSRVMSFVVAAYYKCALKLFAITKNSIPLTESAEKDSEDAKKYIDEIDKLIDEIRDFYDKFKYKEIIIPRKKKKPKMYEYVLGALQRKYTLKIPIYKVEGTTKDVKDIVENQFIDKLESITKKYPNFIILSPSWEEETDMYIYITLREPFGDKPDKKDREKQTQNEAALSTEERNKLQDYEFGIPETRDYPLNDEERIRKAIQFFGYCKSKNKQLLADNIVRRIIELELVGKVTITEKHPNKKYFPYWMLNSVKPELRRKGNKYEIYIDGEKVDYGTLEEHETDSDGHRVVINENGNLY